MTRSVFGDLTRFDPNLGTDTAAMFDLPQLEVVAQAMVLPEVQETVPEDEAELQLEPAPLEEERQRLEATELAYRNAVQQLAESVGDMARQARADTLDHVVQIASALFPALGKTFLCEEISSQLPALLSKRAGPITLVTAPGLKSDIEQMVARDPIMAESCSVRADAALGDLGIQIDWKTGGYDLDFSALLEACIARLQSKNTQNKDVQDATDS